MTTVTIQTKITRFENDIILLKIDIKWLKMGEDGVNRKVVDNVENYLNMKFQPELMTRSRENDQKPIFLRNCLLKKIEFFWKIGLRHFSTLGTG